MQNTQQVTTYLSKTPHNVVDNCKSPLSEMLCSSFSVFFSIFLLSLVYKQCNIKVPIFCELIRLFHGFFKIRRGLFGEDSSAPLKRSEALNTSKLAKFKSNTPKATEDLAPLVAKF